MELLGHSFFPSSYFRCSFSFATQLLPVSPIHTYLNPSHIYYIICRIVFSSFLHPPTEPQIIYLYIFFLKNIWLLWLSFHTFTCSLNNFNFTFTFLDCFFILLQAKFSICWTKKCWHNILITNVRWLVDIFLLFSILTRFHCFLLYMGFLLVLHSFSLFLLAFTTDCNNCFSLYNKKSRRTMCSIGVLKQSNGNGGLRVAQENSSISRFFMVIL